MRIVQYAVSGYGLVAPDHALTPGPATPMFRGFGGDWENWCDQHYTTNNAKCKSQPYGPLSFAPWTDAGKLARGLPSSDDPDSPASRGTTAPAPTPTPAPSPTPTPLPTVSWFDQNKTLVLAAGGLAAVGLLFAATRGRRGAMHGLAGFFGFGKSHRRKKHHRKGRR